MLDEDTAFAFVVVAFKSNASAAFLFLINQDLLQSKSSNSR